MVALVNEQKNDAMAQNVNDRMGTSELGKAFDETDLGEDLPNSYVNTSGDPNQMSRSEEEEVENNTGINTKGGKDVDLDNLSDDINDRIDHSIRISGSVGEEE